MLGPKKDKYKVCSLLDKAPSNFWVQAAEDSQFCQALRSKSLVWHYVNIDAMDMIKLIRLLSSRIKINVATKVVATQI